MKQIYRVFINNGGKDSKLCIEGNLDTCKKYLTEVKLTKEDHFTYLFIQRKENDNAKSV